MHIVKNGKKIIGWSSIEVDQLEKRTHYKTYQKLSEYDWDNGEFDIRYRGLLCTLTHKKYKTLTLTFIDDVHNKNLKGFFAYDKNYNSNPKHRHKHIM